MLEKVGMEAGWKLGAESSTVPPGMHALLWCIRQGVAGRRAAKPARGALPARTRHQRCCRLPTPRQDPAQRLSLPQVMTHSWMTAGGALPPLRPSGRPGCRGAVKALTTAFDNAGSAAAASSTGNGGGAWGHPRRRQGGSSSSSGEEEEQQEAAAEQEEEAQQEQLLRASLEGLVAGEVQVQAFAAGEPLMVRGQPGKRWEDQGEGWALCALPRTGLGWCDAWLGWHGGAAAEPCWQDARLHQPCCCWYQRRPNPSLIPTPAPTLPPTRRRTPDVHS